MPIGRRTPTGAARRTIAGNSLIFSGTNQMINNNNFAANTLFDGITFDTTAGPFTLNGNAVNLAFNVTNSSTNTQTINLNLVAQPSVNFISAPGNLVIGGIISGGGPIAISGPGATILTATNTYTGGTTISGGTLALASSLALQNSTLDTSGSGALSFGSLTAATFGGLTGPACCFVQYRFCRRSPQRRQQQRQHHLLRHAQRRWQPQ